MLGVFKNWVCLCLKRSSKSINSIHLYFKPCYKLNHIFFIDKTRSTFCTLFVTAHRYKMESSFYLFSHITVPTASPSTSILVVVNWIYLLSRNTKLSFNHRFSLILGKYYLMKTWAKFGYVFDHSLRIIFHFLYILISFKIYQN